MKRKSQHCVETQASAQSPLQKIIFGNSSQNLKTDIKVSDLDQFCLIFLLLVKYFAPDYRDYYCNLL